MTVKDFAEMVNRVLFCTKNMISKFAGSTAQYAELYLEKTEGNLIMTASSEEPYYQSGFVRHNAGDDFPDFHGTYLSVRKMGEVAKMKGVRLLSISPHANKEWDDVFSIYRHYTELRFTSESACISVREDSSYSDFNWIGRYGNADKLARFFPCSVSLNRLSFLEALNMVASIANLRFSCLLYLDLFPGTLVLRTFDFEDSAIIEIPCEYSGNETTLTFEVKLLAETIKHIGTEHVSIRFAQRKVNAAILPVHSRKETKEQHDYFFILGQKIIWEDER